MKDIFAVSILAIRGSWFVKEISHRPLGLIAESKEHAEELGMQMCNVLYPVNEGYRDHQSSAVGILSHLTTNAVDQACACGNSGRIVRRGIEQCDECGRPSPGN